MIKKITLITLAFVIVGSGLFLGCHARKFRTIEGRIDFVAEKISSELDLTDAQQKTLDQIKIDVLDKIVEKKAEHKKMHNEVLEKIKENSLNKAYLNQLFNKKEALQREMRPFIIEKVLQFNNLLDDGQRAVLVEKIEELKKKHCAE